MKLAHWQVRICIAITLLLIVSGQGSWIYNMYRLYEYQLSQVVNSALETAILREYSSRHEQMGGTIVSTPLTNSSDTSRHIIKTIRSADTSFQVTFDRYDPHSDTKIGQFMLKDILAVNVKKLDSIFREELALKGFLIDNTYIEYIDLTKNRILKSSRHAQNKGHFISSDTLPIDIFNSLAITAYTHSSVTSTLQRMTIQLILSTILIAICVFLLFTVIRTFFWREKIELMRQDSVNAMTHEFKRPIAAAVTQASLIPYYLQKNQTDRVQQYADNILLELNKLTAYTERVQKLSRDSMEHIPLNKQDIVLRDFFEGIVEKYESIQEKQVQVRLFFLTLNTHIRADILHFSNIIENLIENAIKYSKETVVIEIRIAEQENTDKLEISIKDNGIGITPADVNHVFDRFYRGTDKSIQQKAGFGLGLTYVKALVEAHNGIIKVASKYGTGTEFSLFFPVNSYA